MLLTLIKHLPIIVIGLILITLGWSLLGRGFAVIAFVVLGAGAVILTELEDNEGL